MITNRGAIDVQFGVMALFALGYYPLPVLFKPISNLADFTDEKVFYALLLHWVFFISLLIGAAATKKLAPAVQPLAFGSLDRIAERYRFWLCFVAFALQLAYVATTPQTSYAAEDFNAYFEEKSPVRSILAAASGLSIGFIAMSYAKASIDRHRQTASIFGGMLIVVVLLTLPLGQRLAMLTPIVVVLAAMASTKQTAKALRILAVAVVVLLIVSPFAVYLREARRAQNGDFLSASEVAGGYTISDDPLMQSFQSILGRSDLIYVTVYMKDYIDNSEYVGWEYYYSVLVSPLPRFLYLDKPYVLSSNGRIDGEISALSWNVLVGGLGSLTAFGGLTAYREGGWIGVVLDGLADGAFFVLIGRWLGQGGWIARILYSGYFVQFAVQKAPPCFLEAVASFLGQSPVILCIYLISKVPLFVQGRHLRRIPGES